MSTAGKILNGLWYLSLAALILSLSNSALSGTPTLLSYVTSESMEPTLQVNDYYFIVPKSITRIGLEDIVVFRSADRGYFVHRVVQETDFGLITKGDNSPFTDQQAGEPFVQESQIIGRVLTFQGDPVRIPYLWKVTRHFRVLGSLIRKNWIWTGAFFLLVALVSFYLESQSVKLKKRRRKPLRVRHFTLPVLIIVLVVSTVFMILAQEKLSYAYVSTYQETGERFQRAGDDFELMIEIYNLGPLPHFFFIEAPSSKTDTDQLPFFIPPNGQLEIPLLYQAGDPPGQYQEQVSIYRFLPLLPPVVFRSLLDVHAYLPVLAVDLMLFFPMLFLYYSWNPNQIIEDRTRWAGGFV